MSDSQSSIIESSTEVNQLVNKLTQGAKNESKIQRKNTLEAVKKQFGELLNPKNTSLVISKESSKLILRTTLSFWNDATERCRELSTEIVDLMLANSGKLSWDSDMSSLLIMSLTSRLGGKELKEPSEEIRLQQYNLAHNLIESKASVEKATFEVHFQELVSVLVNSLNDNYAEVKKKGCSCTRLLASKLSSSVFHMQSETFVKPLLANILHQHSRVRKDIVDCLCDVILHGNNKSVTDVVPHLAQRLFDQAPMVRLSIIKLVGTWLLDLPDRYSFWHRLIPLLLTGFVDEALEIKELTESLWWDVGMKYQKENEEELKDKANFLDESVNANYPPEFKDKRPNLGCRELLKQNASKIVPGILNDVGDWVEATRIKSIQLLYIMIWQCENNITMNLETVLQTLFKASQETLDLVQKTIFDCARLLGHFVDANLALKLAFKSIRRMQPPNPGAINILNGLLIGHDTARISFELLIETLSLLQDISLTTENGLLSKLFACFQTILPISKYDLSSKDLNESKKFELKYLIFKSLFSISALSNDQMLKDSILSVVKTNQELEMVRLDCLVRFVEELKVNCDSWTDNSLEPIIFAKLIQDCGLAPEIIDHVVQILKSSLNPLKEPQLRTRFLLLIPEIFASKLPKTTISNQNTYIEMCFEEVMNEMIFPNTIWKAGRAATAVRMSSVASLLLILQTDNLLEAVKPKQSTIQSLIKTALAGLDDENKSTRLYSCKIFSILLHHYGKTQLDKDQLHKFYPEFIKRLDDQSEEIRLEILKTFRIYFDCLKTDGYDKVLYQAHLQMMFENLLLYLDDSSESMQKGVFELVKHASDLDREMVIKELNKVQDKHKNKGYCQELMQFCQSAC